MRHGDRGSGGPGSAGGCKTRRARDAECGDPRGPAPRGSRGSAPPSPAWGAARTYCEPCGMGACRGWRPLHTGRTDIGTSAGKARDGSGGSAGVRGTDAAAEPVGWHLSGRQSQRSDSLRRVCLRSPFGAGLQRCDCITGAMQKHPGVPGPCGIRRGWPGRAGPRPLCLVCVIAHHRSELGRSNNNKLFWYLRGNCT